MDVENNGSLRIDEQVFKNLFDKFYLVRFCVHLFER